MCEYVDTCAFHKGRVRDIEETNAFLRQLFCMEFPERCNRRKLAEFREVSDAENDMTPWGVERCKR